jgi:hypothetical protein
MIIIAACMLMLPLQGMAEMASDSYRITTTVISSGGSPMGSANYRLNGTLGQPSPLVDPADPPYSQSFDLLTGFWYTVGLEPLLSTCPADFQPDGAVDEDDLATLAGLFGNAGVHVDADGDGDMDGLDLFEMAADYHRTDCFP